jgi:hypothetical protein
MKNFFSRSKWDLTEPTVGASVFHNPPTGNPQAAKTGCQNAHSATFFGGFISPKVRRHFGGSILSPWFQGRHRSPCRCLPQCSGVNIQLLMPESHGCPFDSDPDPESCDIHAGSG